MTAALVLANSALAAGSVASLKARGTSFWKKLMMPSICSSAISVKMRGGFLRFLRASTKTCGNLLLALDGGAEANVDGSEGSLHEDEDGVGDAGGVVVGILLPVADDFEGEELAANVVEEDLVVGGDVGVERGGVDGEELLLVGVEGGDLLLDVGGGVVLELGVVLMQASLRADGGGEVEVDVGEELVGDEVEGLGCAVGGEALGGRRWCEHEGSEEGSGERFADHSCMKVYGLGAAG